MPQVSRERERRPLTREQDIKSLIRAARRREQEHLRSLRYHIKHKSYIEAAKLLAWATEQCAFAEGLERGLGDG
jgi:hypothetical protein